MAFRSPYVGTPSVQIDTDVPSFVPQIADLGTMMDHFTQRRMQLAQMQEKERSDREKDLYYRGRNAATDKRNAMLDTAARTKHNADTLRQVRSAPGAGPVMMFDKTGNSVLYSPEFDPGNGDEPATLPDQPAGGQSMDEVLAGFGKAPGTVPTEPAPEPQASVTAVPPPKVEGATYHPDQQTEQPVPREPQQQTVFYDEPEEDYVQALMGPNDEQVTQLPRDAFPPGAREGQRFDRNDVGEDGRKGNPFAEPLPMGPQADTFVDQVDDGEARVLRGEDPRLHDMSTDQLPPGAREGDTYRGEDVGAGPGRMNPEAQPLPPASPEGNASVTRVAPTIAEGDVHDLRQVQNAVRGPRWVYKADGQEPIVVDIGQIRAAKEAEAQDRIARLQEQYKNELNPANQIWLAQKIAEERMMLGEGAGREMRQNYARVENREDTQDFQAGEAQKNREARATDTDKRLATQEKVAAMRKRKGGGVVAKSSGPGSAFSKLKPMEQARVEISVNTGINMLDRQMNWNQLEGKGFDRLDLALENIRSKGKLGGAAQMEAMMNFFGYIRGGVPAKNETDEFKKVTGTLWTWLEKMGMKLGGAGWEPDDKDKAAFAHSLGQLPEAQRAGLEQAIRQSQGVLYKVATKNIQAQMEAYKSAGQAFHERAQDKINAKLRFMGMPARQWFQDSPLIPDFDAESGGQDAPAQGGAQGSPSPKPRGNAIDDLARSLP